MQNQKLKGLMKKRFLPPKPEKLIERILQISTMPGDYVLDSFAGSEQLELLHIKWKNG